MAVQALTPQLDENMNDSENEERLAQFTKLDNSKLSNKDFDSLQSCSKIDHQHISGKWLPAMVYKRRYKLIFMTYELMAERHNIMINLGNKDELGRFAKYKTISRYKTGINYQIGQRCIFNPSWIVQCQIGSGWKQGIIWKKSSKSSQICIKYKGVNYEDSMFFVCPWNQGEFLIKNDIN